jgi:nicotinamidase-related amidase
MASKRNEGEAMSDLVYRPEHTALLFVDRYNDFLSEGGKLWPNVAAVAKQVRLLDNLRTVVAEVRRAGIRVFIVLTVAGNPVT